jgi:hypothetical protein
MKKILKTVGTIVCLFVVGSIVASISPYAGMAIVVLILIGPLIALFKPLPSVKLGNRGFSLAVILFVGIPLGLVALGNLVASEKLTALKKSNPAAYLTELKKGDQSKYLTELSEIDPQKHKDELARIVVETARRSAELQAEETAKLAGASKAKIDEYLAQLDGEIASLPQVKASQFSGSTAEINTAILLIGTWNLLYANGNGLGFDAEAQSKRLRFKEMLIHKQAEMLPALRNAYGPAMRNQLWEADGSGRTIGVGYKTVEFVSVAFARNANIKRIHTQIYENLLMLRFTRAQYKWVKSAREFSYYTLESPRDTQLGLWETGGQFKPLK